MPPCYSPLRAVLRERPGGRSLLFSRTAVGKALSLPCGRCIGCRLERARQWAVRIMHEAKCHQDSSFLTLTYDDLHLPRGCATCAPGVSGSLCVCTCQSFLKRLRSRLEPSRIRFFLCGEYGEENQRPHYHAIIFGFAFPDRKRLTKRGDYVLYTSDFLSEVWGQGFASFGSVTFDSASYVANYATKKVVGKDAAAFYRGRRPEFLLMSRRPGIGRGWIDKFSSDVYPRDEVIVHGHRAKPPRYYDQVCEAVRPELFSGVKERREAEADKVEDYVLRSGVRVSVAPSRNAHRLKVREVVAQAKLAQKQKKL